MNDQTDSSHDLEQEELLERYVLGRLSPADRMAFERRLATDPALQEALRQERAILAGVRRAGREDAKQRLALALQASLRPGVPWVKIAALAAMILVVTGIALWQRWFFPAPPGDTTTVVSGQRASRALEHAQPAPGIPTPPPAARAHKAAPLSASTGAAERTFVGSGVVLWGEARGDMRSGRTKLDAAPREEGKTAKMEATTEPERPVLDTHAYRVEIASAPPTPATTESAATIPTVVHFTVRVRGDSVIIVLPAHLPRAAGDEHGGTRVTRLSPDSVIIEAAGVRIRGYLPEKLLP